MKPTISIVVAIFNRKDELFELLNSLNAQSDKDFEIIIVDDGSFVDLKPTIHQFEDILTIKYFRKDNEKDALDALLKDLLNTLSSQDQLLLKGSNSMKLSTLIDGLC